jgi:hypothetical protein
MQSLRNFHVVDPARRYIPCQVRLQVRSTVSPRLASGCLLIAETSGAVTESPSHRLGGEGIVLCLCERAGHLVRTARSVT